MRQAVSRLAQKDAARGITTTLVALDGADLGAHRAKSGQPETYKTAVDHVWGLHHQPDYVLILGGPERPRPRCVRSRGARSRPGDEWSSPVPSRSRAEYAGDPVRSARERRQTRR